MKTTLAVAVGLLLAVPAGAHADGWPVSGLDGLAGVETADGAYRYVTFGSEKSTVVARIHVDGGEVARHRTLGWRLAVPAVAYDSSASGLSADGRTLVLIRPRTRLNEKGTRLVVLDTRRFAIKRTLLLHGNYSFDAISPDGSKAYLVEYRALTRHNFDPTDYAVRVMDTSTGRLDPRPVVDPREPDEKMGGMPVTRASSPDGRWAYTLYSGSEHPFIHALDTNGRTARCIDLDQLSGRDDIFQLKLRMAAAGGRVDVVSETKPLLSVNTRTFAVSTPARVAAKPSPIPKQATQDGGPPTWTIAAAVALVALLALTTARPLARATRAR
jgi:DNA-binding beta-propeller fold protein YncE